MKQKYTCAFVIFGYDFVSIEFIELTIELTKLTAVHNCCAKIWGTLKLESQST